MTASSGAKPPASRTSRRTGATSSPPTTRATSIRDRRPAPSPPGLLLRPEDPLEAGIASWWLDAVGCIPVDRDGGTSLDAIKRVLAALREEKVIILFPEGTRSPDGTLQPPKAGVGLLACRAHVPVVPARIFGSAEAFGRGGKLRLGTPVSVTYGQALQPPTTTIRRPARSAMGAPPKGSWRPSPARAAGRDGHLRVRLSAGRRPRPDPGSGAPSPGRRTAGRPPASRRPRPRSAPRWRSAGSGGWPGPIPGRSTRRPGS